MKNKKTRSKTIYCKRQLNSLNQTEIWPDDGTSVGEFKIISINMLKVLLQKVDIMHQQIRSSSGDGRRRERERMGQNKNFNR